jgi:putative copper resistance protein D
MVAALIVAAAVQLAQSVPARHDAIDWWLPVRLSADATWDMPWTPIKVWSGAALLALAILLAGLALRRRASSRQALAAVHSRGPRALLLPIGAAAATLGAAALALPALSVDAYPDTYRKPSVPYQTLSVAAGAELFAVHCTSCHGRGGRGDGKQAERLALPPADLTAPHTALHTAGDIFWWLTHGKPPGSMPGFGAQMGEDQRWDVINFLRTLSAGYQARILEPRIARLRPWLGAVDFAFVDQHGAPAALKDHRGRSAVLLVFFTPPGSHARLAQLAREHARLRAAGAEIIAVPMAGEDAVTSVLPFAVVADGAGETAHTYALLRRTLANPDTHDTAPAPPHMEMLVDRFGYIRARWVAFEGEGWQRPDMLLEQLSALAREPQILPPPDDHVH